MVWPILISVAVTPRISADSAANGQPSMTSAATAPNFPTERIDTLPLNSGAVQRDGARRGCPARSPQTWHGGQRDANRNHDGLEAKTRGSLRAFDALRLRDHEFQASVTNRWTMSNPPVRRSTNVTSAGKRPTIPR